MFLIRSIVSVPENAYGTLDMRLKSARANARFTPCHPVEPEVHADPLDAHIPFASKFKSKDSPSINWKEKFALPGNLFSLEPFK